MKDKELLKKLLKDGWKEVRVSGSHHILEKEGFKPISLPVHGKDIKVVLEVAILKHAKLK